jgi:hypothetical protein
MTKKQNLYVGQAGQARVMSEFLIRGYNVAVPEVDIGDDLFVVDDRNGSYWKIQIKTSEMKSASAFIKLKGAQLATPPQPELAYVFVFYKHSTDRVEWLDYLVFWRAQLSSIYAQYGLDTTSKQFRETGDYPSDVGMNFSLDSNANFFYAKQNINVHKNNWSLWPTITW